MPARENSPLRAYLDIETTGLSPHRAELTVVGICLEQGDRRRVVQLYEKTLTRGNLLAALKGADILYTYNGARFDIPFIEHHLRPDLAGVVPHCDLMHHCWDRNLWGGLKAVEAQLGISRESEGLDGFDAVRLWWEYRTSGSRRALSRLLQYNAEDVTNLAHIRRLLKVK